MSKSKDEIEKEPSPKRGKGYNQSATIGGLQTTLTTNEYEDGRLAGFEFRIEGKVGVTFQAIVSLFSRSVSMGLQHGIPLEQFVDEFTFTRFEPDGMVVGNDSIKNSTSVIDYLFRELGISYLDRLDLAHVKPGKSVGDNKTEPLTDIYNPDELQQVIKSIRKKRRELAISASILIDEITTLTEDLHANKPNNDEELEAWKILVEDIEAMLPPMHHFVAVLLGGDNEHILPTDMGTAKEVLMIRKTFVQFFRKNSEILETSKSLTIAGGFIALFSLAGANMAFATPAILAMIGGKKVMETLKEIDLKK